MGVYWDMLTNNMGYDGIWVCLDAWYTSFFHAHELIGENDVLNHEN